MMGVRICLLTFSVDDLSLMEMGAKVADRQALMH